MAALTHSFTKGFTEARSRRWTRRRELVHPANCALGTVAVIECFAIQLGDEQRRLRAAHQRVVRDGGIVLRRLDQVVEDRAVFGSDQGRRDLGKARQVGRGWHSVELANLRVGVDHNHASGAGILRMKHLVTILALASVGKHNCASKIHPAACEWLTGIVRGRSEARDQRVSAHQLRDVGVLWPKVSEQSVNRECFLRCR
mmetsp:Transcript_5693/g.18178  ORF Transcript_5693/g.18178 Transcript_5693/m.18178 type:complete len:200 (-) Transcript_5693:1146-1745(-)